MSSSLSSVVSNLVRASMGSSVSNTVTDSDLDRHVAELILKEAKKKAERYGEHGIRAYLPTNGMSDSNAPRTNKRFLSNIIRSTDDHNKTILRAQAQAAQEVKREREEQERRERRARAEEAAAAERLRRSGHRRARGSEDECWDRWDGKTADRSRKRKKWESYEEEEDDDQDTWRSRRRRSPSRSRSREHRKDKDDKRSHAHETGSSSRRHEGHRSSRRAHSHGRHKSSGRHSEKRHGRSEHKRSSSHSSPHHSRSRSPVGDSVSVEGSSRHRRHHHRHHHRSHRSRRPSRSLSPEQRLRSPSPAHSLKHSSSKKRLRSPSPDETYSKRASPFEPHQDDDKPTPPALPERVLSSKRHKAGSSSATANTQTMSCSPSRSPTPGPDPAVQLPSKMDKYFEESYDPRLDVAPLAAPKVPATGLINNAEFEGWDAMLELIKIRREDKEEKKRMERLGLTSEKLKDRKPGTSSGVSDRWGGEGVSIMEIEYKKRGSVREWDLGKEGF